MTNIAQYLFHKCKARRGSHFDKYGPFYVACIATPLVVVDLLRHVLVDDGIWTANAALSPAMYLPYCNSATARCLTVVGWFFTIFCTWTGYALLVLATVWASNVILRVKSTWRKHRGTRGKSGCQGKDCAKPCCTSTA